MSIGDLLPVVFYEIAFIATGLLLPVLVWRADVESYVFGVVVCYFCLRAIRRRKRSTLTADGKAVFISGCDSGMSMMSFLVISRLISFVSLDLSNCWAEVKGMMFLNCSPSSHTILYPPPRVNNLTDPKSHKIKK